MKKHYRRRISALAALFLAGLLAGCGAKGGVDQSASGPEAALESVPAATAAGEGDFAWSEAEATAVVEFDADSIRVTGSGAAASGTTLTISAAGTYVLRGTLADGQVLVEADKDDTVRLVLDGVDITCQNSAAIYSAASDKTVVILASGSHNTLADGAEYAYASADADEPDAALFSKDDLTIGGEGSLTVTGSFNNGIGSKDDLLLAGGEITVTAENHAIRGRDSLTVTGGSYTLAAGNDGLQSNNDGGEDVGWITISGGAFNIQAAHDGIQAETDLTISGGTFEITTAKGHSETPVTGADDDSDSFKALKAGGDVTISGGTFAIDAADDAVHGNGDVTISGGDFTIATGDDGVHADGDLLIEGGTINITASYEGLEGGTVTIRDGEIRLVASDDGINAAGGSDSSGTGAFGADSFRGGFGGGDVSEEYQINFEGGYVEIDASGDGFDSNGGVTMSGGTVIVHGPTTGADGAVDYELTFAMTGGTLVAAGASGMAMGPTAASSTQPSLMIFFTSQLGGGDSVELQNAAGETLASYTAPKSFNSIVLSNGALADGEAYTILVNGGETGTVTLEGMLTSVNESGEAASGGMMGGFGGMGGGPGGGMGGFGGEGDGNQPPDRGEMPDGFEFDGEPPDWEDMPEPPGGMPGGDMGGGTRGERGGTPV